MIFVTDASQELTAPEVDFLRQALERCPAAVCVVTKTDLYPEWRRIVELDRQHLAQRRHRPPDDPGVVVPAAAGVALPRTERGVGVRAAVRLAARRGARGRGRARRCGRRVPRPRLRPGAAAPGGRRPSSRCWPEPEASEEVVGALRRRSERTRKLVERGNGWQQFLFDGIEELVADVKHDLAGRMRAVVRDVEAVIDQGDPKETWPDIEVWLQRQVVRGRDENHDLLNERAAAAGRRRGRDVRAGVGRAAAAGADGAGVDVLRGLDSSTRPSRGAGQPDSWPG